ncbi:MAG: molecular chaperone [Alphaproteobacteria bacterium]
MSASHVRSATARAEVYRFLALAFADPTDGSAARLRQQWPITEAALTALGLPDRVDDAVGLSDAALGQTHLACFGHALSKECPPYEAEYGQAHIFEKTQTLADISGFYKAFGLQLSGAVRDRPDHLAFELEFMEFLCQQQAFGERQGHPPERVVLCRDAQRTFLDAHLGRWAFSFAHHLIRKSPTGIYAAFARLLEGFLEHELDAMGIARRADPFLNEADVDQVENSACGACPVATGTAPLQQGVQR